MGTMFLKASRARHKNRCGKKLCLHFVPAAGPERDTGPWPVRFLVFLAGLSVGATLTGPRPG